MLSEFSPLFQAVIAFVAVLTGLGFVFNLLLVPLKENQGRLEKNQGRLEKSQARLEESQGRLEKNQGRLESDIQEVKMGIKRLLTEKSLSEK